MLKKLLKIIGVILALIAILIAVIILIDTNDRAVITKYASNEKLKRILFNNWQLGFHIECF